MRNKQCFGVTVYLLIFTLLFPTLAFGSGAGETITNDGRLRQQSESLAINNENNDPFVGDKLSPDLRELTADADQNRTVKVILQSDDIDNPQLLNTLKQNKVKIESRARALNMLIIQLPLRAAETVAQNDHVKHLSLDLQIESLGHVEMTTGRHCDARDQRQQHY